MADQTKEHEQVVKSAMSIRKQLVEEWNKGLQRDPVKVDRLLNEAKILLTTMSSYLPLNKSQKIGSEKEMELTRELLELGARASVAKMAILKNDDSEEFDRYMAQLKHYYFDAGDTIKPSVYMFEILGMNLLKLLSQNRISEFHLELELFVHSKSTDVLNDVYIKKAWEIEQALTEGRYNKILALLNGSDMKSTGLKSSGFRYFVERVVENSRKAIAEVMETAYDRLDKGFALKALHAKEDQFNKIAKERNWTLSNNFVYFTKKSPESDKIPAVEVIQENLRYARDLDSIV